MANTYEQFTTTGQTVFTLPFSSNYLLKSHVKVYKGRDLLLETQTATLSEGTDYTFSSATQITLSTGLASGEELTIQRQTPEASQLSPWNDGSNLTAEALNKADLQCLYVVQEQSDLNALNAAKAEASKTTANTASTNASNAVSTANAALPKAGGAMTGHIAMGTNKITGLGDPTAAQDAATKTYVDTTTQPVSAKLTELATMDQNTANALADLTQAEVQAIDGVTATTAELNILDGVTATKDELNILDGVTATKDELNILDGVTATKDELNILDGVTATKDELNILDGVTATTAELNKTDGLLATPTELNALDGITANTSELNKLDGVNASTTELNIVSGKSFRASTDGALSTTSDTEMPSSKVIANHVAAQIGTVGGFTTIANDASFPATASQPANGVIISISDAQGVAVSGTTSTTGRTVDGTPATVTINNFPSSLTGETLASGVGLLVTSTGSGNIYNYHKLLAAESDVKQLSDDINDFNARYRIASSAPGSNNDDGDLWFDTSAKKMKVYNGTTSQFDDVASVGSFFVNTLSSSSATGGGSATFNGSAYRFTLSNAGTSAQQHIVSVNGVIQKPNSGTSQPSEGFAISSNDIIFSAAPASGSDFFIITCGSSVSIGTPSANSVNSSHIIDGSIVNGDISSSANIAGSKVADDSIPEVKLDIHNAPATDKYLKYTSNGMEWSDGAPEGTDVKSTGESGTTKFLRVDGDGTCSWQVPPDTNTQVGGDTGVTFNDNVKSRFGTGNDANIHYSGTNWLFENSSGIVHFKTDGFYVNNAADNEAVIACAPNGNIELYYDSSKKFETTTNGVTVTGTVSDSKGDLRSIPYSGNSGAYTLVAADAGKVVGADTSWTIPASTFSAGDAVTLLNLGGSDLGLTASALTYLWNTADGTNIKASTLTLGARSMATVYFKSASEAFIQASKLNVS